MTYRLQGQRSTAIKLPTSGYVAHRVVGCASHVHGSANRVPRVVQRRSAGAAGHLLDLGGRRREPEQTALSDDDVVIRHYLDGAVIGDVNDAAAHAAAWSIVDPLDVRWVFLSHDDRDHSGNLLAILATCPNATLLTTWFSIGRMAEEWESTARSADRCRTSGKQRGDLQRSRRLRSSPRRRRTGFRVIGR